MEKKRIDVVVIGGAGHVGLPLALSLAKAGNRVAIYDNDEGKIELIKNKIMPFNEFGAEELLNDSEVIKNLRVTADKKIISQATFVVILVGTPIDEHLSPVFDVIKKIFLEIKEFLIDNQIVILRSTLYPGVTETMNTWLKSFNRTLNVCYCPERIAEGKAIEEIKNLPQIVSGFDRTTIKRVKKLFLTISPEIIEVEPTEAELSKLFSNAWRYIKFAIANQFYMIAEEKGLDYSKIYDSMTRNYPRNTDLPKPGFAAGPCLFKDTMQLAAFVNNDFYIGHSAMMVNENLPMFVVNQLKLKYNLKKMTVGVLGMAFKANSDDKRESLAYKLKNILEFEAKKVMASDVYIKDSDFVTTDKLINDSDIIIIGCFHKEYKNLDFKNKIVVNIWL